MGENTTHLFNGDIIHCIYPHRLEILKNHFLYVENGKVKYLGVKHPENIPKPIEVVKLNAGQFIIPGFIDTHIHGPQYPNIGIGYHLELLDWLKKYTFPQEVKFNDHEYAKAVYTKIISRTLKCGTTTASYFGTCHLQGCITFADIAQVKKQRCFIGYVNMIDNSPDDLRQKDNDVAIDETVRFVEHISRNTNSLVQPVITPRFALSCNAELLSRLGDLVKKYDCHVQTHISENKIEILETLKMHSECKSYAEVYDRAGLLTKKTILAHGVYLTDDEKSLLSKTGTTIAHCPNSNTCLHSGLCDVRALIDRKIPVGLGTDVSGGSSPSILDAMRSAITTSNHIAFTKDTTYRTLNYVDVFYLATMGGATALRLDDRIGNFAVGKEFDALVVDVNSTDSPIDIVDDIPLEDVFQKFIYVGDDRNILNVFVAGCKVI